MEFSRWRIAVLAAVLARAAAGQVTQVVSVDSNGAPGHGRSAWCAISPDGRFVVFRSGASDLVPGDTNGVSDVFVRDRVNGTTERVSVATDGTQGNGPAGDFTVVSADGRFVGFDSYASNLVPGDVNGVSDVFVHDRRTGITECISVAPGGMPGPDYSQAPALSADARYVAFYSDDWNLVPGDTNGWGDVFVRDRLLGTTERVSVSSTGVQANAASGHHGPSISADGRFVTFSSRASNLAPGTPNHDRDIFVRDRRFDTTERVSLGSSGAQDDGESSAPTISDDGRFVAFMSDAANLVPGDTNGTTDVFVRDREAGTTVRASVDSSGLEADGASTFPFVSGDGRLVAFASTATSLVPGDTNGAEDVFVRDLLLGTTERVSVGSDGTEGDDDSRYPWVSHTGRFVAFESAARALVPSLEKGARIYVRDREGGPEFSTACDPGTAGVLACPCGNPPGRTARGCDNSAATGGATLEASGGTYLSSDSLVFTSGGEVPNALSLLVQSDAPLPAGAVYGQGVRCATGASKRLYTKVAAGGGIVAPDFGAGDATVSRRSFDLGDPIAAGESRWYVVYYRDPVVLGGCPIDRTFNATTTGRIAWAP